MTRRLRQARNVAASAMAASLFHAPVLERPYAHAAFACRRVPGLHTLFRETTDRLARRLVESGRQFRRVRIGDISALLDVSDFTVRGTYFSRVPYERGATELVMSVLESGGVFVDIGANSGYFTVLAALRMGERGRVFAFEPNPVVRQRLQQHVSINRVARRVVISDVAIAGRDENYVDFFLSCWDENSGISSLTPLPATVAKGGLSPAVRIQVPVRTFDTWASTTGLNRADLIKIDVEGAESDVLSGMRQTLDRLRPPRIICETVPGSDAGRLLIGRGYRVSMLDEIPGGIPNLLFSRVAV